MIKMLPGPSRVGSVPRAGRLRYLVVLDALTLSVAAAAADLLRGYIRSTAPRLTRPGSKESTSLLGAEGPARLSTAAQRVWHWIYPAIGLPGLSLQWMLLSDSTAPAGLVDVFFSRSPHLFRLTPA